MSGQTFWKARLGEHAVLNPIDRTSEVLFGLILALTFTGAISVAGARQQEVHSMLWATLGGSVAWGLVDAIMYMMSVVMERGHVVTIIKFLKQPRNSVASRQMLRDETTLAKLMTDDELDRLVERLRLLPTPARAHLFAWHDLVAAMQIFGLVFLCTLPVSLPFIFLADIGFAVRISNGIAILFLLVGGYLLAGYAGFRRIPTAIAYAVIGVVLVAMTMALGG